MELTKCFGCFECTQDQLVDVWTNLGLRPDVFGIAESTEDLELEIGSPQPMWDVIGVAEINERTYAYGGDSSTACGSINLTVRSSEVLGTICLSGWFDDRSGSTHFAAARTGKLLRAVFIAERHVYYSHGKPLQIEQTLRLDQPGGIELASAEFGFNVSAANDDTQFRLISLSTSVVGKLAGFDGERDRLIIQGGPET